MTSAIAEHSDGIGTEFRIERWVFAFGAGITILAGYLMIGQWNLHRFARGTASLTLSTRLDRVIPLVPLAIWPYVSYYLIALSPTFLAVRWREMRQMGVAYFAATVVAWAFWIALPVRMLEVRPTCTGLSCRLLSELVDADGGVNVFPSLHVAHSVLAWLFFRRFQSSWAPLVGVGAISVALSTVLTRQHYLVDLPAGVAVALFGWWAAQRIIPPATRSRGRVSGRGIAG